MKHPTLEHGIYTLKDLKLHYARVKPNGHWFERGTMQFFKCRLSETLLYRGSKVLFFSSEQGPNGIRRYSIREYDPETGAIETVGLGFQGYKTLAAAKLAARNLGGTS